MSILNKRNAVLGWVVWRVAKRKLRQRTDAATGAVTGLVEEPRKRRGLVGVLAAAAAAGGALLWWRRSGDEGATGSPTGAGGTPYTPPSPAQAPKDDIPPAA